MNYDPKDLSAALDAAEASLLDSNMDFSTLPNDDDLLNYFLSTEALADRERFGSLDMTELLNDEILMNPLPFSERGERNPRNDESLVITSEDLTSFAFPPSTTTVTQNKKSKKTNNNFDVDESYSTKEGKESVDHMTESEEKREKRLKRNRESARNSRRRKKQYLELLEEKVSQLTQDLDTLRNTHLEEAGKMLKKQRIALLESLETMIGDPTKTHHLDQGIRMLNEHFGPCCEERRLISDYFFKQFSSLLLPSYSKFLLWMMNQGDAFYNSSDKDNVEQRKSLWNMLVAELSLTPDQESKIRIQYKQMENNANKIERRKLSVATMYLSKLREAMNIRARSVQHHAEALQKILTPEQNINYLLWVERNRARLQQCHLEHGLTLSAKRGQKQIEEGQIPPAFLENPKITPSSDSTLTSNDKMLLQSVLRKPDNELTLDDASILVKALLSSEK